MGANTSVYVAAVNGGMCLTRVGRAVQNKKPVNDKNQLWTIERKDNSKTVIAFRSNADGKYFRAVAGHAQADVECGARQWWELEDGQAHGSYWLKCLDFPNAYLANYGGGHNDGNRLQMWPKQEGWVYAMNWYIQDAQAPGFVAQAEAREKGTAGDEAVLKKEEELKKKEEELQKSEGESKKKEEELKKKEEELKRKEDESKKKEKEFASKEKELAESTKRVEESQKQMKAAEEKEKNLAAREQAIAEREKAASGKGGSVSAQQQALSKKAADLEAREKQLADKEKKLATSKESEPSDNKLLAEKKALEAKLAEAQKQLSERSESTNGSHKTKDDSEIAAENQRLRAELAAAKKQLSSGSSLPLRSGVRPSAPPATRPPLRKPPLKKPERKLPPITKPAAGLPSGYNKDLLARFEAGRRAIAGAPQQMRTGAAGLPPSTPANGDADATAGAAA